MFEQPDVKTAGVARELSARGHPPAQAACYLVDGRPFRAIEICREHLREDPQSASARLIYALALYHTGQTTSAAEQFYGVLSVDPDNLAALKHLGDIQYAEGDEIAALANYARILEIDPHCRGLKSDLDAAKSQPTQTITLSREAESSTEKGAASSSRWKIHFYTETIGDLYLAQGHPRLAAEVFRKLSERSQNPRLAEKLARAESRTREKEH